jgi:NADH-quinone oxidoreductase subunit N
MMVLMLSLAGLPPTAGFYAKLAVFSAAVSAGYIWLAVAAVLLSLVGAYYYLRIVKLMYFDDPKDAIPAAAPAHGGVLMSVNGLALLVFGIVPGPLMDLCTVAIASL